MEERACQPEIGRCEGLGWYTADTGKYSQLTAGALSQTETKEIETDIGNYKENSYASKWFESSDSSRLSPLPAHDENIEHGSMPILDEFQTKQVSRELHSVQNSSPSASNKSTTKKPNNSDNSSNNDESSSSEESFLKKLWNLSDFGVRIYLPERTGDQEKWGGIDISFDLSEIGTFLQSDNPESLPSLTVHLGIDWPKCFTCNKDCSNQSEVEYHDNFFKVAEGRVFGLYVAGFSISGKPVVEWITKNKTFLGAFKSLWASLADKNVWEVLKAVANSVTFSPGLALGLVTTKKDWKTESRNPIDYSTGEPICEGLPFIGCSLKRSPLFNNIIEGKIPFTDMPKIKDYECSLGHPNYDESKTCEVSC